jgi:hypothetical protein
MGKSKLGDLVRTMAEKAALDGRKVNHSARTTTITSLLPKSVLTVLLFKHSFSLKLLSLQTMSTITAP